MNLKTIFSEIKLNLSIFFFTLILVFPVNILVSLDNQITIEFVKLYDYVYTLKKTNYIVFPTSFILIPYFIYIFFLDFKKSKIFFNHKTILFFAYLLISISIVGIFYFKGYNFRLIKNFILLNILIFFLFYSKIFFQNYSHRVIEKGIYFSVLIISYICLNNLFNKIMFNDKYSVVSTSKIFFNLNISHYPDYFPYLVFMLIGIIFFSKNNIFNLKEKFIYILILIVWLFESIIYQNKGLLIVFLFFITTSIFFKSNLLKKFFIKNLYLFYLPMLLMLLFSFSLTLYGIESSLDERFRAFVRNYEGINNILFPLMHTSILENYNNNHNDFLEIYTLYGIFSFFIYNFILLKIRKIMIHNFFYGYLFANIFFLGSIVQNNFLNPYLLIIISLTLGLDSKNYFKRI